MTFTVSHNKYSNGLTGLSLLIIRTIPDDLMPRLSSIKTSLTRDQNCLCMELAPGVSGFIPGWRVSRGTACVVGLLQVQLLAVEAEVDPAGQRVCPSVTWPALEGSSRTEGYLSGPSPFPDSQPPWVWSSSSCWRLRSLAGTRLVVQVTPPLMEKAGGPCAGSQFSPEHCKIWLVSFCFFYYSWQFTDKAVFSADCKYETTGCYSHNPQNYPRDRKHHLSVD